MNQAALPFDDGYPEGFWWWLKHHRRIYNAFEYRALQMAMSGRTRYSARTIMERIRWETDLRDRDVTFKCNGNWVPGMARLFMQDYGYRFPNFFELRRPAVSEQPH